MNFFVLLHLPQFLRYRDGILQTHRYYWSLFIKILGSGLPKGRTEDKIYRAILAWNLVYRRHLLCQKVSRKNFGDGFLRSSPKIFEVSIWKHAGVLIIAIKMGRKFSGEVIRKRPLHRGRCHRRLTYLCSILPVHGTRRRLFSRCLYWGNARCAIKPASISSIHLLEKMSSQIPCTKFSIIHPALECFNATITFK
jgi:hypothetical protein